MIDESAVQKLVRQAANGSSESFGKLYDLYSARLFNFIFGRTQNKETAQDLLHTVFLKAWTNLRQYKTQPNAKFATWLYQIANFTVIDHWRTSKPTQPIEALENLARFASNPKLYENYAFLWEAMQTLPEIQQKILDLRFIQDLNVAETAEVMGKGQISVRVIQHRALKALRKILLSKGHGNF